MVVDLAVVDDPETAVGGTHGLMPARRRVKNRQAPGAERDAGVGEYTLVVRSAVRHAPCGANGPVRIRPGPFREREAPSDPRHPTPMAGNVTLAGTGCRRRSGRPPRSCSHSR